MKSARSRQNPGLPGFCSLLSFSFVGIFVAIFGIIFGTILGIIFGAICYIIFCITLNNICISVSPFRPPTVSRVWTFGLRMFRMYFCPDVFGTSLYIYIYTWSKEVILEPRNNIINKHYQNYYYSAVLL